MVEIPEGGAKVIYHSANKSFKHQIIAHYRFENLKSTEKNTNSFTCPVSVPHQGGANVGSEEFCHFRIFGAILGTFILGAIALSRISKRNLPASEFKEGSEFENEPWSQGKNS